MKRTMIAGLAAALVLAAAGCGGDDDDAESADTSAVATAASTSGSAPDTEADDQVDGTSPSTDSTKPPDSAPADDAPQRIVSMSATHTEILFAIGAGDQVTAVDDQSDFPKQVKDLQAGLSAYEPKVELIASEEPDVVVLSDDMGLVDQLDKLGIEDWLGEAAVTFDDMYTQIEQLGALTGHVGEAAELVGQMQADIEQVTADIPRFREPLTVYHELDPNLYSASSRTFIGAVYDMFGLVNIADEAKGGGPYPQLNAEYVVESDPDLMFLADAECCNQNAKTVAARDGWADISAVRNDLIFETPDDIASRWGPRIVEYIRQVRKAVDTASELERTG